MRLFIRLVHATGEDIFAVSIQTIDQSRMMRGDTEREHLSHHPGNVVPFGRQGLPNPLRSSGRMIDFAAHRFCIDVSIGILIKQAFRRFDVILESPAVFAEVMDKAKQFTMWAKSYFFCNPPRADGDTQQMGFHALRSIPVPMSYITVTSHVHLCSIMRRMQPLHSCANYIPKGS
jgi:hypothetical protein